MTISNEDKNMRSRAFTLAESLITIMIIGVLMALMLRAINRVNPDKDKLLFIKAYHATESVIADVISDPTKYDQAYYTDKQRADEIAAGNKMHSDFRDAPYETARVTYIDGTGKAVEKGKKADGTGTALTQDNAMCYFMADQINTIGEVNCDNNNGISVGGANVTGVNFRSSIGACFLNWNSVDDKGFKNAIIDPTCTGVANGYVVHIYNDGKMSVPNDAAAKAMGSSGILNQDRAFNWMNNQSQLK